MTETNAEQPPPRPPEKLAPQEPAQMSEMGTIAGIFFEPGRVFEDLRRKPRFIIASVIIAACVTAYVFTLYQKVGEPGMRSFMAEQMDKSPQTQSLTAEQKKSAIDTQMTIQNVTRYVMPVFVFISLLIGGLLYWAAAKAFGGSGGFLHNMAVWIYGSLPPTVVATLASILILMLKPADEINIAASQRTAIHANPSFFIDGSQQPVLATLLATLDVFFIWGWILAAIGLRITNKISSGSAWAIVVIFGLIGTALRIVGAYFSGNPT